MQWFKHQSSATNDAKLRKLIMKHGPTGYAVYFHCLELITGDFTEQNVTFELEHDSEIIADNLKVCGTADKSGVEIVEDIMRFIVSLDLFTESDGHIRCFKLIKNLDTSMTSNPRFREMIAGAKKSHDSVMISHDSVMQEETRLDKTRREQKKEYAPSAHPAIEEISAYCKERANKVDPQAWLDHYTSNGWKVGRTAMKDWKAAVRTWERNQSSYSKPSSPSFKGTKFDPSKPSTTSELL